MKAMIRLAHFSDLHYAGATLTEVDRCFSFAVDQAIARGVDCAVISGDSTDHALEVHAPAVAAFARVIRRLADHCPVLILQGTFSHEPPGTLNVFRLLGGRFRIHVADRLQQVALDQDGRWLESEGWRFDQMPPGARVLFSCVPTVNKAVVAAAVGAAEAAEAVGERLTALLRGFAPINEAARAAGVPTIGVSHGTVYGCVTEHGVPMAGFDHEFTTGSLFGAGARAFLLGHIHKHQSWHQDGRVIAYAGSIGRLHYGEQGDKGFLIWNVGAASACFELIATPAKRTVEIAFEGMPKLEELQQLARTIDVTGAFVRVRWTVPEEDRHEVDRSAIQHVFGAAAEIKLEGRVIPVVRTRAAGISNEASIAAKIAVWARLTEARPKPLLACLEALQTHAPDEIAGTIIECSTGAQGAIPAVAQADTNALGGETIDAERLPMFSDAP
ncbi:MAG: metallophosphatase family protein [Burkholderiales bacterium]|nr:metallophosphatase family protein [Burkholderiales bacterium]